MLMKRILFLVVFFLPMWICAEPIDVETARQKASDFLMQHTSSKGKRMAPANRPLRLLHTQRQTTDTTPTLYVFGNEGSEGYVVVAGDDVATTPVLGYSKTGKFNADSIPCSLRFWLDEYGRQLNYARNHPISATAPKLESTRESIEPLITSKWHQHEPFNNLCPIDPETGDRCPTGCAATAMAQIMYYHKWPEQGVGNYSYEWNGQTLTADFGSTIYQWDKMKDTYNGADDDLDNAVATLMYHCGVAMNTIYSSTYGSAININWGIEDFLANNLHYSHVVNLVQAEKAEQFETMLYKELLGQRPSCVMGGGHAFVCDGYENGYFHFNFGWGGANDDYYLLSAITPGSYDFSSNVSIIYGIRKAEKEYVTDDARFELYPDGTAHLVRGYPGEDYVVPDIIQLDGRNYEVTTIEDEAFRGSIVSSITIPNTVTYIGQQAFAECVWLTSVSFPCSVTYIGERLFHGCDILETIQIESGNEVYNSRDNCNAIIETASNKLIVGCKSSTVPVGVTSIADCAFEECTGLTSLTIADGVTYIGERAFYCCYNLTSLTIPNSVTDIGKRAFESCESLTSVNIPTGITSLPEFSFCYCFSLKSITIPKNVTAINDGAFYGCSLSSLTIPSSVINIGEAVFCGGSLNSIQVESGNTVYDSRDNCNAIIETANNKLIAGCKNTIIPNSVTSIYDSSFRDCGSMTSIVIPANVTSIGWCAFSGCYGLTDVYCLGNAPSTSEVAFFDVQVENVNLHVPAEYIDAYKLAEPWKSFKEIKEIVEIPVPTIIGDANDDGEVNATDIVDIVSHTMGKPTSTEKFNEEAADANEDGVVNAADIVAIVNIIMGN